MFIIISVFVTSILYLPSKLEVKPYLVIVSSFDRHYHCSFVQKMAYNLYDLDVVDELQANSELEKEQ